MRGVFVEVIALLSSRPPAPIARLA
jgi:hypothetical protein